MGVTFIAPEGVYTSPAKLITKEITENGTYSAADDSANGYSSVTVNVEGGGGSSDFSTAEVSITCVTGDTTTKGKICLCVQNQIAVVNYGVPKNQTVTLTVPLYKGSCRWLTEQGEVTLVSGSATIDPENHYVTITGDCTLKIYVKQV